MCWRTLPRPTRGACRSSGAQRSPAAPFPRVHPLMATRKCPWRGRRALRPRAPTPAPCPPLRSIDSDSARGFGKAAEGTYEAGLGILKGKVRESVAVDAPSRSTRVK